MCVELRKMYLLLGSEQDCNSFADVPVQSPGSGMIYTRTSQMALLNLHWGYALR